MPGGKRAPPGARPWRDDESPTKSTHKTREEMGDDVSIYMEVACGMGQHEGRYGAVQQNYTAGWAAMGLMRGEQQETKG